MHQSGRIRLPTSGAAHRIILKILCSSVLISLVLHTSAAQEVAQPEGELDLEKELDQDYDFDEELLEASLNEALKLTPVEYLGRFGYLDRNETITEESFSRAVKLFQKFMSIPQTGDIDEETVEAMKIARCGDEDIIDPKAIKDDQKLRYIIQGGKWNSTTLRYKISSYPQKFLRRRREINEVLAEAFDIWSKVIPIQFVREKEKNDTDIDIRFVQPSSNTTCEKCKLFAKSSSIVAHSHYPDGDNPLGGDIHFNGLIDWVTDESAKGESLLAVALHEIGHALGLGHTQIGATKMFPLRNGSRQNLHTFDVVGIQKIYFKRSTENSDPDSPLAESSTLNIPLGKDDQDVMCPDEACKLSKKDFYPGQNCQLFYDCRNDVKRLMTCPDKMAWNKEKNWCDFIENVPNCVPPSAE